MTVNLHTIAELLALRFVDCLAEGTVICLLAALALRLAPRQNAATRFTVWFSALIAITALPWISGLSAKAGVTAAAARHATITLPDSWALYLFAFWAAVALWFVLGVARALWHLHALRRNRVVVSTADLHPLLRETLQRHGAKRQIVLCISEQVRVPTAVGLFKPMILVPSWVMRDLSPAELNQVLLHELAHFRRWDDWTNLLQQIVKAVFFFHPAVWWIDRQVAIEREMACDDAVVAETQSPRAYAECLAHLAEKSFVRRSIALAQAALGQLRQTSARIAQILDVNRPKSTSRSWGAAASLVAIVAVGCGTLYSRTPRLIAFGSPRPALRAEVAPLRTHGTPEYVRPVPVLQAKWNPPVTAAKPSHETVAHRTQNLTHLVPARTKTPEVEQKNLVHLTKANRATVPVTETFWLVVESEGTNPAAPQIYEIQMWRVTVLRTVINAPSRQAPRNET